MSALRAAFDEERAWLRACDDERAVLDRMAGYRDNMAFARRAGNVQAHAFAEHLVELAEDQLTMLKVGATKAKERAASPPPTRVEPPPQRAEPASPPPEPPARSRAEPVRADDSVLVRQLQAALSASQEAERRAARERDAADRRARDASAERDSVVASQRRTPAVSVSQPAPTAPPVKDGGWLSLPTTLPSALSGAKQTSAAKSTTAPTTATRPGQTAAASPPASSAPTRQERPKVAGDRVPSPAAPTPPRTPPAVPPISTTAPSSSPPPDAPADAASAALTGADLAAFRRGAGLNQVAAAQRLGVTQGTISKAEGNPRTVLGPVLQEALRRAAG